MSNYTENEIEIVKTRIVNLLNDRGELVEEGHRIKDSNNQFDVRRFKILRDSLALIDDTLAASWGELYANGPRGWCGCSYDHGTDVGQFFEVHDITGTYTGIHGFMCERCLNLRQAG